MTTQRKELSEFQRGEIIGAWKCKEFCEKLSERKISEILGYPKSTVHEVIAAYRDHGIEKPSPRSGRPPILTERDGCHLMQILNKNHKTNLNELYENFVSSTSVNVSKFTLRRYLHKLKVYGRIGAKKPFVNAANRMKRLSWAKKRKNWIDEWEKIIWSDESRFVVFGGDGKRYVWRTIYEKYNPNCLIPTFKSGQESVMI